MHGRTVSSQMQASPRRNDCQVLARTHAAWWGNCICTLKHMHARLTAYYCGHHAPASDTGIRYRYPSL